MRKPDATIQLGGQTGKKNAAGSSVLLYQVATEPRNGAGKRPNTLLNRHGYYVCIATVPLHTSSIHCINPWMQQKGYNKEP